MIQSLRSLSPFIAAKAAPTQSMRKFHEISGLNRLKSKLKNFYNIFIAPPKQWRQPKKSEILIYDACSADALMPYLAGYSVEVIPLRGESVNVPCLLRAILMSDFWKGDPIQAYVDAFIRVVSPNVVLTFIDNKKGFYNISNRFPAIKTIFLQNGRRAEIGDVFGYLTQSDANHVDYMLVFDAATGRHYRKLISGEAIAVGSLINNGVEKSFDLVAESILFISQYRDKPGNNQPMLLKPDGAPLFWEHFYATEVNVLNFLSKWCAENNKLLRISGFSLDQQGAEFDFYTARLKGCKWEYIPRSDAYSSYKLVDAAEIVVFIDSTLGYESIGRGKKTAGFSCRGLQATRFGWPADLPDNGPFWTNEANETEFRRVLDYLATVSDEEWENTRRQYTSELMEFDAGNKRFKALLARLMPKSPSTVES